MKKDRRIREEEEYEAWRKLPSLDDKLRAIGAVVECIAMHTPGDEELLDLVQYMREKLSQDTQ